MRHAFQDGPSLFQSMAPYPCSLHDKGQKAKECDFLHSASQVDYNTNLAGPLKTSKIFSSRTLTFTFSWKTVLTFSMREVNGGTPSALQTSQGCCMRKWLHLIYLRAIFKSYTSSINCFDQSTPPHTGFTMIN